MLPPSIDLDGRVCCNGGWRRAWHLSVGGAGCGRSTRRRCNELVDALVDRIFGHKADDLFGYLAALEQKQSRNATDAITHRRCRIPIYVHLHHLELADILRGHFIHDGRQGSARPTPGCPKIDQNRLLGLQHLLLECRIVYFKDSWSGHVPPSLPSLSIAFKATLRPQ